MEEYHLYANHYEADNGEKWLGVYQGVYQHKSTRGNMIYPTLKRLGNVNITTRVFYKGSKHPRKIIRDEGQRVFLFDYHNNHEECVRLNILFTEMGYPEALLNEIINIVLTASNDKSIHSRDYNRVGGENDGIVPF